MKSFKKTYFKFMVMILALLLSTTAAFAEVPEDVQGMSYEQAVDTLMEKGIITGDTDGNFNPDSNLTRAQACIIIVKSMNPPTTEVTGTATQPALSSDFEDLSGYSWAEGYIAYAVEHGVTNGYPDGTFKPGNSVTMNELVTMVLRAAGYSDESIGGTWPSNYMDKADELNLLSGMPDTLPTYATKWIAAQVDYNALDVIEKANPQDDDSDSEQETSSKVPDIDSMAYVEASFDSDMTTFNGKDLADDMIIYTYGLEKNYSSDMDFSEESADYHLDTVYKYKNVETPAFYQMKNNEIVAMVVPRDVGFSGRAYVVINGTVSATNGEDEKVTGLETFAAAREIKWLGKKGLSEIPSKSGSDSYLNGTVYELNLKDGEIQSIYQTTENHKGDVFDELSGSGFQEITEYKDNVVTLDSSDKYEIKDNATIYIMDEDNQDEYEVGRQSNIKKGNEIRIYDMTDDDDASGDIVVVLVK